MRKRKDVMKGRSWSWLFTGQEDPMEIARPMLQRILASSGNQGLVLQLGLRLLSTQRFKELRDEIKQEKILLEKDPSFLFYMDIDDPADLKKFACSHLLQPDGSWSSPALAEFWKNLLESVENGSTDTVFEIRLRKLCTLLELDPGGEALLRCAYLLTARVKFKDYLSDSFENNHKKFYAFVAVCGNVPYERVQHAVRRNGPIFSMELLGKRFFEPDAELNMLELAPTVYFYLDGLYQENLQEVLMERVPVEHERDLEKSRLSKLTIDIILGLLKRESGSNILLYGGAGLGKTSFTKALSEHMGYQLYLLRSENEKPGDAAARLRMAVSMVDPKQHLLLVDEADSLLNCLDIRASAGASRLEKGWLNQFLESHNKKIIWITNRASHIEESTLRRFDFCCGFREFDDKAREEIWKEHLQKSSLDKHIDGSVLRALSLRYALSPANINTAVRAAASVVDHGLSVGGAERILEEVVRQQARALGTGHSVPSGLNPCSREYSRDYVNSDPALEGVLESCRHFLKSRRESREYPIRSLSLLFYGLPGTGKTEFAKHLALDLGMKIILKKASDLLSCWVGGTEKNIREAFEEAREKEGILFIDEADSLLSSREGAVRSWEVTQVNELLVQMENHEGISIFSTNFEKILDSASLRRFAFKIRFSPLKPEQAASLFSSLFGLPAPRLDTLAHAGEFTFGDFKTVHHRLLLKQLEPKVEDLIEALRSEGAMRQTRKRVGF